MNGFSKTYWTVFFKDRMDWFFLDDGLSGFSVIWIWSFWFWIWLGFSVIWMLVFLLDTGRIVLLDQRCVSENS